jgi:inositol 1,4,5-triphosphate receptor type 3
MHPQERLLDFIAEFEKDVKAEIEKERHGLVEVFMNGGNRPAATKPKPPRSLSKRRSIASQLQAAERESTKQANTVRRSSVVVLSESSTVTYTRNLIWQLSNVDRQRDRSGARALTDMAVAQTTASLKVLISMLTMHKHDTTMRKRQQQLLTLLGAPTVVLVMASCENDELCMEGLKLGNALLEGGNRDVQAAIYKKLTDPAEEESIRAFDGSPNTFLSMMRRRLRLAKSEVRERKIFYDVQDEMRELMAEEYSTASSATLAQLQREVEREFPARSHVNEALEMLRLLCEGHNNDTQDLMHIQGGSISNVDLVGEAYELLAQLEPEIDESNISQMQKCIDTLVEFVQGNEAQIISAFLLDTKLLEILDRIIQKQSMPYIEQQELLDLQLSVALLLLALLEGKSHRAEVRMLSILDVRRLAALAGSLYDATLDLEDQDDEANGMSKAQREKANDTMLDVGSRIYMLVSHLLDSSEHIRDELGGANVGLDRDSVLYHLRVDEEERHVDLSYYRRYIARVELINADGQIEYAYFRFPAFCLLLTDDSKDRLLWGVDRSTPGRQIQSFFDSAQDLHQEMRHQESLNESHLWRVLTFNRPIALNAMFLIAIVQNSLIILSSAMTDSYGQSDDQLAGSTGVAQWIDAFVSSTLGMMQATACIVVFLVHAMQEGPLRMRMRRRRATGMTSDEIQSRIEKDTAFALWNSVMMPYYLLTDTKLLFYIFAFVAAVLGITRSPLFYAFHLLDMVNKSTDLQSVFRAVTQNGRAILMTAVFGFVVIYLYAIIGFAYGQDLFMAGDYPDGSSSNEFAEHPELSMCRNLYVCWVSAVVNGLREGDIGKIMEPRYSTDERYGFIVVYQFTYYLIVITVLLNVIFGIIIDTFGQLRTEAASKRASMENACFICGVDRFTFDTQGNGFLQHISVDHNMWHYLFMIIYLREKDPTDYNGWEQYVAKKMRANDTSFFPLNNAIVLKEHKEHQERGSVQLFETVQGMAHAISEMGHNLERVEKQFMDRVDTLTQQHRSLELALQNAFSQAGGQRQP